MKHEFWQVKICPLGFWTTRILRIEFEKTKTKNHFWILNTFQDRYCLQPFDSFFHRWLLYILTSWQVFDGANVIFHVCSFFCLISMWTRQVYNLFQDLWNKALGFLKRCKKGAKTVQTIYPIIPFFASFQCEKGGKSGEKEENM